MRPSARPNSEFAASGENVGKKCSIVGWWVFGAIVLVEGLFLMGLGVTLEAVDNVGQTSGQDFPKQCRTARDAFPIGDDQSGSLGTVGQPVPLIAVSPTSKIDLMNIFPTA